MGAGKSFYAVARQIVPSLLAGKYAVTNVELLEGWEHQVAAHVGRTASAAKRKRLASRLLSHYIFETELQEGMRYRLPGKGEARGVFVWDEGHNDLNNRSWRDDTRGELLEWGTQLRKLGYVGFLLSQSVDNTDAQLRRICNFVVKLQNQREQTRMLGLRITPWPLFLAAWFPAHVPVSMSKGVQPVRVERYFLGWQRKLYDTWGLYHGLMNGVASDDAIQLPSGGWLERDKAPRTVRPARVSPPGQRVRRAS
jgi:hypothetical protein